MLNKVCIMGRLTDDPIYGETYTTSVPFVHFSLAVERDYIEKSTGKREPDYIKFTAWRGMASWAADFLAKGKMVVVEGHLRSEAWVDPEGAKCRNTYVAVDNIYFAAAKQEFPSAPDFQDEEEPVEPAPPESGDKGGVPKK
ncbi:MAG: single-stranded DNA-binding protein [Pseudoflavonifractor sp.]|nr:single-stranded DNA-binding protein [Pseudoflavonifractor sp.]